MHPLVTVHLAQSLDGRLALDGMTTALSTAEGQRSAHTARARNDAVIVGSNTIRIDDPRLTVRHAVGPDPLRVILASTLDLPLEARVFDRGAWGKGGGQVLVIGARERAPSPARSMLINRGVDVDIVSATDDGLVSLEETLTLLGDRGVKRVLVEGGARVLTSFFRARLVDFVEIEVSMRFLGAPGTMTIGAIGVGAPDEAIELSNVSVERLGANLLVRGEILRGESTGGRRSPT
jgi:diaminohydroxyphosphoribosylaminopyrimidine deaminase / 5-amino-6-(5-phosphoribosylamino)uracil reductase